MSDKDIKDEEQLESSTNEEVTEEETEEETSKETKTVPYERFKEVNDQLKDLKDKVTSLSKEEEVEEKVEPTSNDDRLDQIEFLATNREVTKEELAHLVKVRNEGESLEDTYKREKDYLEFQRKRAEEDKKVPEPSASTGSTPVSPERDLSKKEDRQAWVQEQEEKLKAQKGRGSSANV